jgi:hypothetical protein
VNSKEVEQIVQRFNNAKNGRQRKKQFKLLLSLLPQHPVIRLGDVVLIEPELYFELVSRVEELEKRCERAQKFLC